MKKIIFYISITFIFSWSLWGLSILSQNNILPEIFQLFGMFAIFGPLVAFIILTKQETTLKKKLKELFISTNISIYLFVIITPFILSGISYLVYYNTAANPERIEFNIVVFLVTTLMILFIGGPIEEFGWRGYLLPKLRTRYTFIISALVVGVIHGIWHLPLHFMEGTVQSSIPILEFIGITILTAFMYSFIYEFTKSIIPMIILHLTANLSSALFPYYYNSQGRYTLFVLYVIVDVVLIIIYFKKVKNNVFN